MPCRRACVHPNEPSSKQMTFIVPRPLADPDVAARRLVELANAFEPVQMRELPAGRYIRTGAVLAAIPCSVIR
jgi:hypothetical protein